MDRPVKPGRVLRVGVVGSREFANENVASRIAEIFAAIEGTLLSVPQSLGNSDRTPEIRLISGLADGSDQIAAETFLAARSDLAKRTIAAVLPFDIQTYRDRSSVANVSRFERLLGLCRYVLELDGCHADGEAGSRMRSAAYRAQAGILLRQADILLSIEDPEGAGKPGGTRETITRTLALGIPIVHVALDNELRTTVVSSIADLDREIAPDAWKQHLAGLVRTLITDPRTLDDESADSSAAGRRQREERHHYEGQLIADFFSAHPPTRTLRSRFWAAFETWFKRGPAPQPDQIAEPFVAWEVRATQLSGYYAGLYRGTFLFTYGLALLAVLIAVASQTIRVFFPDAHEASDPAWSLMLAMGVAEFLVVATILWLTKQANQNRWNEKAVDYRYLAERLRSTGYLPAAGSLRAHAPESGGYATRVGTQTVVDWLFQSMMRQVSLEDILGREGTRIRFDPRPAAIAIRDRWIANQDRYHARNADAMGRMSEGFEKGARAMTVAVVAVVFVEVALHLVVGFHAIPAAMGENLGPWFSFLAATLPAAVASANAIRFQTECARLADRSNQMRRMLAALKGRTDTVISEIDADARTAGPHSGHAMDVLHLAEDCAKLTLDEVAEWSFVYAKEIVEP